MSKEDSKNLKKDKFIESTDPRDNKADLDDLANVTGGVDTGNRLSTGDFLKLFNNRQNGNN